MDPNHFFKAMVGVGTSWLLAVSMAITTWLVWEPNQGYAPIGLLSALLIFGLAAWGGSHLAVAKGYDSLIALALLAVGLIPAGWIAMNRTAATLVIGIVLPLLGLSLILLILPNRLPHPDRQHRKHAKWGSN